MRDFVKGLMYLPRGAAYFLKHASLWPYALMPFILNGLIVTGLAAVGIFFFNDLIGMLWDKPEGWLVIFWFILAGVVALLLVVVLLLAFVVLAGVIAGPFNGKLARATRELVSARQLDPAGGIYVDVVVTLANELRKMLHFLTVQALLLLLNLVPGVGSLAYAALSWYFTALFLAYAFLEYSIEQESWVLGFRQRVHYLQSRRWACLGFGTALGLLFLIPLINILVAPLAVVGGALLYEEYGRQSGLPFDEEA